MEAYSSGEAWGSALERLFNPDPEDSVPGTPSSPSSPSAIDARVRDVVRALYIPNVSHITIDGRTMDFEGLVQSVYRVRRTTVNSGAVIVITVRNFVRNDTVRPPTVRCLWRIAFEDHPPESGRPPAKRPLPPVVEVQVDGTLDQPGPDGRAVAITAQSQAVFTESSGDDSSD